MMASWTLDVHGMVVSLNFTNVYIFGAFISTTKVCGVLTYSVTRNMGIYAMAECHIDDKMADYMCIYIYIYIYMCVCVMSFM